MVDVRLKHVTKKFDGVPAAEDLNFKVKDEELLVLVGPSGCGKTTTLRLIAGLEKPDKGKIYFGDELINDVEIKDRGVSMVFQDYALYPHMTVSENMGFALRNMGYEEKEIEKRIKNAAELMEIEHLLERKPGQLSGGQKQRAALGRAVVREPKVYLWDEPLSNLDAKLRVKMRAEMQKLQRKLNTTTIHVTHDQVEAMTMADRVAIMHKGQIRQLAPPEEVYEHPADKFVAGFIGTPPMNFMDCKLKEEDGELFLETKDFSTPVPSKVEDKVREESSEDEVILGVRPENVYVGGKKKSKKQIPAEVDVVEPIGSDNLIHLNTGEIHLIARVNPNVEIEVGEEPKIRFDEEKMHIFDEKTEKAIF